MKKSTLKKILLLSILSFVFIGVSRAEAATLYAKTAGGNWSAAGTWSTTGSGGADNSGPPTAADDVILETGSGNVTITAAAVARSVDMTSGTGNYAGVLNHDAGFSLTIGDATAGAGNVALKFLTGTYTIDNVTTSAIAFISTSATVQTVDFAGLTTGDVSYNASSNGSWQLTGTHNTGTTATVTLTKGTLDTNGQTASWGKFNSNNTNVRTLTLGASNITITGISTQWDVSSGLNLTFNSNTSTITFTGFMRQGGSPTFNDVIFSSTVGTYGTTSSTDSSTVTFANLTVTGPVVKTSTFSIYKITVTGTLTLNGNSTTNRLLVSSNTIGTASTLTAANVSVSNADFRDITGAGAGSWDLSAITGLSGDAGGNTNITFTTAATQTATGTASFTWSTHGWTSRVPLPQDDVVINNAFSASQTVTADMPRLGKSIDFTGATGTPALTITTGVTIYGSLTLISGMTLPATTQNINFEGRSAFTITSAGKDFSNYTTTFAAAGGTYTLQDNFSVSQKAITINKGTFNANNFNITANNIAVANLSDVIINMGSGTWTFSGSGNFWNFNSLTLPTINANTSTIHSTSTAVKAFLGGGYTYNILKFSGTGTNNISIYSNNTFNEFQDIGSAAHSILFNVGTTQTITTFTVSGTSGAVITLNSLTTGTYALVKANGGVVSSDYLNIQHSVATPANTWYAGANSTDNQATATAGSGWIFTVPPAVAKMSVKIKGLIKIFGGVKFR